LGALKVHIKAVHLKIRDKKCPYCEYAAAGAQQLKKHLQKYHATSKYRCTSTPDY
jgi:hypothetical protein